MSATDVTPEEIKALRKRYAPFQCDLQTSRDVRRILDALEAAQAELARLRSAPVAVEAPEPTGEEIDAALVACRGEIEQALRKIEAMGSIAR